MSRAVQADIVYFGKLPSRGDFVRNGDGQGLTRRLDRWLTQGLATLARGAHWKPAYDRSPPCSFALLGVRSRTVVAGHLMASRDASGRRFPFVAAAQLAVDAPLPFLQRAPLALTGLWRTLALASAAAQACDDAVPVLNGLDALCAEVDTDPLAYETGFSDFLERQTIGSLQAMLQLADAGVELRRTVLGLGLLLQPVPGSGAHRLEKALRLPLPTGPRWQAPVATLWLDLVARFLGRAPFELVLMLPPDTADAAPSALIGFAGDSPAPLCALLGPAADMPPLVDLVRPDWVDEAVAHVATLHPLVRRLDQAHLSLAQLRAGFTDVFLREGP